MADEIQVTSSGGLQQIQPTSFTQSGDNNTQIGYVQQQIININQGGFMMNSYMPSMINNQYYNLFVVDQTGFNGMVSIPRKTALDDYTDVDIRRIYAKPKLVALEKIKQLPSVFVIRNKYGNHTDPGQNAGLGYVINMEELGDVIRIMHTPLQPIQQELLNGLERELDLKAAAEINELDVVHWSIKKVDIMQILNMRW